MPGHLQGATVLPLARRRHAARTITPPILARWLEVKLDVVHAWIKAGDLPALNIGTKGKRASYRIFRKDLAKFLQTRGLGGETIQDLLSGL